MRTIVTLIVIALLGTVVYFFRAPIKLTLEVLETNARQLIAPCSEPKSYRIGSFDERFKITEEALQQALLEAEAIWEKPTGKDLFAYAPSGKMAINLLYDYRQEATSKLKNLGLKVDESKANYDVLNARYSQLKVSYEADKASYDQRYAAFMTRKNAYDAEVASWNAKGGAPQSEFARLEASRRSLQEEAASLQALQAKANQSVSEINALVVVLNHLAATLNIEVGNFNTTVVSRGEEFEEGLYTSTGITEKIDIYEFSNHNTLVRLLAHELGHSLGLEHVEDEKAIMYRVNQSTNETLTAADIAELKLACRFD